MDIESLKEMSIEIKKLERQGNYPVLMQRVSELVFNMAAIIGENRALREQLAEEMLRHAQQA